MFALVCVYVSHACSIYRCEALDGIVSYTRPGQDTPDEFVRIDIRGKAFVYVSHSLILATLGVTMLPDQLVVQVHYFPAVCSVFACCVGVSFACFCLWRRL